jgi:hypothetical protein
MTLFLPEGSLFKLDSNVRNYDRTDGDYFTWDPDVTNAVYKVNNTKIKCLNCPAEDEDEDEEVNVTADVTENDSITTTTVKVNGETVTVNNTGTKKGLSKNKDGVIIKN